MNNREIELTLIPPNRYEQKPINWDILFARLVDIGITIETEKKEGTDKESITFDNGTTITKIRYTKGESIGRERIEISPVTEIDEASGLPTRLFEKVGIVTKQGKNPNKPPAGEIYKRGGRHSFDDEIDSQIKNAVNQAKFPQYVPTEIIEHPNQTIIHKMITLRDGKIIDVYEIKGGNGHGRKWATYTNPHEVHKTPLILGDTSIGVIHTTISYGLVLEQGDTSDKERSRAGEKFTDVYSIDVNPS